MSKEIFLKDAKFTDQKLLSLIYLSRAIERENKRQLEKWGIQSARLFEWLAWTTEEYGEFVKALNNLVYGRDNGTVEEVLREGIQTATLLLKMIEIVNDLQKAIQ